MAPGCDGPERGDQLQQRVVHPVAQRRANVGAMPLADRRRPNRACCRRPPARRRPLAARSTSPRSPARRPAPRRDRTRRTDGRRRGWCRTVDRRRTQTERPPGAVRKAGPNGQPPHRRSRQTPGRHDQRRGRHAPGVKDRLHVVAPAGDRNCGEPERPGQRLGDEVEDHPGRTRGSDAMAKERLAAAQLARGRRRHRRRQVPAAVCSKHHFDGVVREERASQPRNRGAPTITARMQPALAGAWPGSSSRSSWASRSSSRTVQVAVACGRLPQGAAIEQACLHEVARGRAQLVPEQLAAMACARERRVANRHDRGRALPDASFDEGVDCLAKRCQQVLHLPTQTAMVRRPARRPACLQDRQHDVVVEPVAPTVEERHAQDQRKVPTGAMIEPPAASNRHDRR